MSKPKEILAQIVAQLQADADLSFIPDGLIFKGYREGVTTFPCIFVEPIASTEDDYSYPVERLRMRFEVYGLVSVNNVDLQWTGDDSTRGVMDVENAIKLAIDADRTLAGKAIHTDIIGSEYRSTEAYPIKFVVISIEVLFSQTLNTR